MLGPSRPGTREFFFLERYLLFLERRKRIFVGQVHHSPYPAQAVEVLEVDDELVQTAGLIGCEGSPEFSHYVSGVDVEIFDLHPV